MTYLGIKLELDHLTLRCLDVGRREDQITLYVANLDGMNLGRRRIRGAGHGGRHG